MATNTLDILSIAEFKTATRFIGDTSHDAWITSCIKGAVGWLDEHTACGVLERNVQYIKQGQPRAAHLPIPLRFNATLTSIEIRYPTSSDPHAVTFVAEDRLVNRVGRVEIAAPDSGWMYSTIEIEGVLNIAAAHIPPILKQTAILLARRLYDGEDIDRGDWAVNSLIAPYKSQRRAAPGLELSTVSTNVT